MSFCLFFILEKFCNLYSQVGGFTVSACADNCLLIEGAPQFLLHFFCFLFSWRAGLLRGGKCFSCLKIFAYFLHHIFLSKFFSFGGGKICVLKMSMTKKYFVFSNSLKYLAALLFATSKRNGNLALSHNHCHCRTGRTNTCPYLSSSS